MSNEIFLDRKHNTTVIKTEQSIEDFDFHSFFRKKSWILDLSTDEDSITFIEFIFLMREIMEKIEEGTLKNNPMNGVYIKIEKFSDNEYMPEFFKRARKLGVKYTISN